MKKCLPNIIKRPEKDLLFRPFYPARRRIQENRWRKWAHIPMISPKMSAGDKEKNKGLWSLAGPTLFAIYPACVRQAGRLAVFGLARRCWGLSGNTIQQFSLRRADGSAQFLQGTKKAGGIYNEGEGCRRKGGCYPALLASGESKAGQHRIVTEIFVCFRKPASGENSRRSGGNKTCRQGARGEIRTSILRQNQRGKLWVQKIGRMPAEKEFLIRRRPGPAGGGQRRPARKIRPCSTRRSRYRLVPDRR